MSLLSANASATCVLLPIASSMIAWRCAGQPTSSPRVWPMDSGNRPVSLRASPRGVPSARAVRERER
jgi:hypothetical protein